jgi:hypothetical protein
VRKRIRYVISLDEVTAQARHGDRDPLPSRGLRQDNSAFRNALKEVRDYTANHFRPAPAFRQRCVGS